MVESGGKMVENSGKRWKTIEYGRKRQKMEENSRKR